MDPQHGHGLGDGSKVLKRLGELVKHLFIVVEGHLTVHQLVHPWPSRASRAPLLAKLLQLRRVVTQLLQEGVILRRDVVPQETCWAQRRSLQMP